MLIAQRTHTFIVLWTVSRVRRPAKLVLLCLLFIVPNYELVPKNKTKNVFLFLYYLLLCLSRIGDGIRLNTSHRICPDHFAHLAPLSYTHSLLPLTSNLIKKYSPRCGKNTNTKYLLMLLFFSCSKFKTHIYDTRGVTFRFVISWNPWHGRTAIYASIVTSIYIKYMGDQRATPFGHFFFWCAQSF